jgi:hypothetical protein
MEIDFLTLVLMSFFVGYLIGFVRNRMLNKVTRSAVARYIRIINLALKIDKNGVSAMEYDDRYTITSNIEQLAEFGMIRLFKDPKVLQVKEHNLKLTDKEYNNILDSLKSVL